MIGNYVKNFVASKYSIVFQTLALLLVLIAAPFSYAQEALSPEEVEEDDSVNHVKFMADDKFMLSGQYYAGKENHSGVLLLHDCSHDSKTYTQLMEVLSGYGIHAFSLDLRGYGGSVSEKFSHADIKKNSKDILTYQSSFALLSSFWESDVLFAYNYLRSRIDKKRDVAIVSAGCSAPQAILLAEKMRIRSFVMITPKLNYMQKEKYKNLIDIPIYFLSSTHHAETFLTAKELFEWNGDTRSALHMFKGIRQGNTLPRRKRYLSHDIALWLNDNLSKE